MKPTEVLEYLAFRVATDYARIRLSSCVYSKSRDELVCKFIYDDGVAIDGLKSRLEDEMQRAVELDIKFKFEYKKSYIDAVMLGLVVRKFLRANFSVLSVELEDEDVAVDEDDIGFTVNIYVPKNTVEYVKNSKAYETFIEELCKNHFHEFEFFINEKPHSSFDVDIDSFVMPQIHETRVNKVRKVKGIEYILGKPIKERPIKIEFLRVCADEQVIAGNISYLSKREYTRKIPNDNGGAGESEVKKTYWTFVLDDGEKRQQCVFFPNEKTAPKFEKLTDGTTICAIGVNSERNGRVSFSVKGVSFCELV